MAAIRARPDWLEKAVFYQVYPQSFQDSNGDGIGDLPGLISRLDYIRSLGCDAIWLNPCFDSPFQDGGYDVRDYGRVAPRYGTNDDLRRLCVEARQRGMRILLDLVPGHTSIEHPWFQASASGTPNEYSDWYIWTKTVWQSAAGLDFVSGYGDRYGKYITNFFWFQPALNFGFAEPDPAHPWQLPVDHPGPRAVRQAMHRIMRFWLDQGVSGFRVDMAGSLIKGSGEKKEAAMAGLWAEVREWMDRDYPEAVLVSEWGWPPAAFRCHFDMDFVLPFDMKNGWRNLFCVNDSGDWDAPEHEKAFFDPGGRGDASVFLRYYTRMLEDTGHRGLLCFPSGNHDTSPRIGTGRSLNGQKCAMAFVLSLPGAPFVYYGDEIGMRFVPGLLSKEGGYNRTASRTPMQWDDSPNAGFSKAPASQLYLPLDESPGRPTVAAQEADPDSLLNTVRRLIDIRRNHPALGATGGMRLLLAEPFAYPIAFLRTASADAPRILCAFNPRREPVSASVAMDFAPDHVRLLHGPRTEARISGRRLDLQLGAESFGWWALG